MTNEQLQEALVAVGSGGMGFVDALDDGEVILDGAFTLQQLVAIGDVARKALGQRGLSGALTEAIKQFGAERLAKALVEPKVGETIRLLRGDAPWYRTGDFATLKEAAGVPNLWWADFSGHENPYVHEDGYWCVNETDFEVVR